MNDDSVSEQTVRGVIEVRGNTKAEGVAKRGRTQPRRITWRDAAAEALPNLLASLIYTYSTRISVIVYLYNLLSLIFYYNGCYFEENIADCDVLFVHNFAKVCRTMNVKCLIIKLLQVI